MSMLSRSNTVNFIDYGFVDQERWQLKILNFVTFVKIYYLSNSLIISDAQQTIQEISLWMKEITVKPP